MKRKNPDASKTAIASQYTWIISEQLKILDTKFKSMNGKKLDETILFLFNIKDTLDKIIK